MYLSSQSATQGMVHVSREHLPTSVHMATSQRIGTIDITLSDKWPNVIEKNKETIPRRSEHFRGLVALVDAPE